MKILFRIIGLLLFLFVVLALGGWLYLKNTAPKYKGNVQLAGMSSEANVYFDDYGIPHIYADNALDAYRALGYVHAQDRLFQMEIIRRVTSGKMSEVLGEELLETDQYFHTLGIRRQAEKTAQKWFDNPDDPMVQEANAYLAGINEYIDNGPTPIEFRMMGIPKTHFTPADIYTNIGYMTLGFTSALKTEPLINKIVNELGSDYLSGWNLGGAPIPTKDSVAAPFSKDLSLRSPHTMLSDLGIPVWEGSNGFVLSPRKSKSGQVLFSNDTHIRFGQPSVWYEAHIEYPDYSFYGSFLAGVPFGIIGHNRDISWGLTIFPMDNMDMYREQVNPQNPNQVWENDHWADMQVRTETINIKGQESVNYEVKSTRHGPLINHLSDELQEHKDAISLWWGALKIETKFLHAARNLGHAKTMTEAKQIASIIDILGLNVLYGDKAGNIALWSCGKIPIRPAGAHPMMMLDGASGLHEMEGFYDFSMNPQIENPESGFVASSNNQPDSVNGIVHYGYYPPDGRINRLRHLLSQKNDWTVETLKSVHMDHHSDLHLALAQSIIDELSIEDYPILKYLKSWDGEYGMDDIGPVVYTKLIYEIMAHTMQDELGEDLFDKAIDNYIVKKNIPSIYYHMQAPWWDNVSTRDKKESRDDILALAIAKTTKDLTAQLGKEQANWQWKRVHQLTHEHPIGKIPTFAKFFNVGPIPVAGGNGVLNKLHAPMNESGIYQVQTGPALRILLDFADTDHGQNIHPTGNSGAIMSAHYKDQATMYAKGIYRPMLMAKDEIIENSTHLSIK